nr:hypothetical protein Q903MT_gene1499 [Picea sitchensis]
MRGGPFLPCVPSWDFFIFISSDCIFRLQITMDKLNVEMRFSRRYLISYWETRHVKLSSSCPTKLCAWTEPERPLITQYNIVWWFKCG